MEVGSRVVAGADGDGLPVLGTITRSDSGTQTCVIQWDGGGTTTHGTNPDVSPRERLRIFDNAPSGVKQQSVDCADCQVRISGFRYMCQVCFAYDLCIACYMGDKHDSEHPFLRYDNEYSDGVELLPRSASRVCEGPFGLLPGATVRPSSDCTPENDQSSKEGLITSQCQWESEAGPAPGAVTVIWQGPEDESEIYRVGYQGKVDLECIEYAEMGGYYPDHLPVLGADQEFAPVEHVEGPPLRLGSVVTVDLDEDVLRCMQEGHGGWNIEDSQVLGKTGFIHYVSRSGDVGVFFSGEAKLIKFNRNAVRVVYTLCEDDSVQISSDLSEVKARLENMWQWKPEIETMLGQVYTVGWVYPAYGTVFLKDNIANNFHFDPTLCTPVSMVQDIAEPPETPATVRNDNPEMTFPPAQHPNTGTDLGNRIDTCIFCCVCHAGIGGWRWKCAVCYDVDLCSVCYMANRHPLSHYFLRYAPRASQGIPVPSRAKSRRVSVAGEEWPILREGNIDKAYVDHLWCQEPSSDRSRSSPFFLGDIVSASLLDTERDSGNIQLESGSELMDVGFVHYVTSRGDVGVFYGQTNDGIQRCNPANLSLVHRFRKGQPVTVIADKNFAKEVMTELGLWVDEADKVLGQRCVVDYISHRGLLVVQTRDDNLLELHPFLCSPQNETTPGQDGATSSPVASQPPQDATRSRVTTVPASNTAVSTGKATVSQGNTAVSPGNMSVSPGNTTVSAPYTAVSFNTRDGSPNDNVEPIYVNLLAFRRTDNTNTEGENDDVQSTYGEAHNSNPSPEASGDETASGNEAAGLLPAQSETAVRSSDDEPVIFVSDGDDLSVIAATEYEPGKFRRRNLPSILRRVTTENENLRLQVQCEICLVNRKNKVLDCGHGACADCVRQLKTCHMCRKTVTDIRDMFL